MQYRDTLQAIVAEWCAGRTMEEIYRQEKEPRMGAPCFAEHNATVFCDILNLKDGESAALYAEGFTADEPPVSYAA